MRLIGLFEAGDFLVGELHVDGGYGVFEVVGLGGADYGHWGGDAKRGYSRNLESLGPKGDGLIDSQLASGHKDGYRFILVPGSIGTGKAIAHYTLWARTSPECGCILVSAC